MAYHIGLVLTLASWTLKGYASLCALFCSFHFLLLSFFLLSFLHASCRMVGGTKRYMMGLMTIWGHSSSPCTHKQSLSWYVILHVACTVWSVANAMSEGVGAILLVLQLEISIPLDNCFSSPKFVANWLLCLLVLVTISVVAFVLVSLVPPVMC